MQKAKKFKEPVLLKGKSLRNFSISLQKSRIRKPVSFIAVQFA